MADGSGAGRAGRSLFLVVLLLAPLLTASGCDRRPRWYRDLEAVGIHFVSAREVKAMLDRDEPLTVIDARDAVHYRNGHLPGAVSIPAEDKPLAEVDIRRPKRLLYPERLPADRGRLLIFYCGGPT